MTPVPALRGWLFACGSSDREEVHPCTLPPTGGAGHIGRAIVDELVSQGHHVIVGDRQLAAPDLPAPRPPGRS
ncbi:MAG: hypothetical protein U0Z44_16780 [Kouleothrix sp.]